MTTKTAITLTQTWQKLEVGSKGSIIRHREQTLRHKYFETIPHSAEVPKIGEKTTIFPNPKIPETDPFMIDVWIRSTTGVDVICDIDRIV